MRTILAISLSVVALTSTALGQLFTDNFTSRTTLPPWVAQLGNWAVAGGVLRGGTNSTLSYGFAYITNNFTDFTVQAQFQFPAGAYGGGLGGRLNPATGSHYAAWIYPENSPGGSNVLKLLRFSNYSNWTLLQATGLGPVGTGSHTVKLEFTGTLINVYFDSNKLITANDATYSGGSVSLDMWTHDTAYQMTVDNVVVNAMPLVANNDSYSAQLGVPLTVAAPGVLANDTGGNSPLSAVLATNAAHGTLVLNSNGSFTYNATNNFIGTDTFAYRATDGQTSSAPVIVTISVISILYSDDFNRTTLSPWVAQSGNWAVASNVLAGGPNAPDSYGLAYLTSSWTNYSVQARVQFPAGAFGGGLGACLNTATGARYAAWIYPEGSLGGARKLKLLKFQDWTNFGYGGQPSAAMQSVNLASVGTIPHTLKLACAGNQIEVYFDETLMIGMLDEETPYLGGAVAAELWTGTTGYQMTVDDVLVAAWAASPAFPETFDGVTAPALPSGWITSATSAESPWFTINSLSDTAPNSVFCPDAATPNISELVSPPFVVPPGQPQVVFQSYCNLEPGMQSGVAYDGGVLEISVGGGPFTDILVAGGGFLTNGYTHTLSTNYGNPLGGRLAWSGRSNSFSRVIATLPASAAGQAARLRWLCATDADNENGGGTGWRIDTVAVKVNSAPVLPGQTDRTILELTTVTVTNTATDADVPADTLTYSLLAKPTGASISTSGVITWTPTEAQGPGTNTFTTRVVDNGSPALSTTNTFMVVVRESNSPPVLPAQPNRTVTVLVPLIVTNTATDPDLPTNTLTYSLPVGPSNAAISPTTGIITWTPSLAQENIPHVFTTVVTDSNPAAVNAPSLSATNSFTVLAVSSPLIALDTATLVAEGFVPTNKLPDPGETVALLLSLKNVGAANTTNLVATLLTTNGVTSPSSPQTYGVVPVGGAVVSQPFTFTASGSCGGSVTPTWHLHDGPADLGIVTVSYTLGQVGTVLTQNFDGVTAPALPAGWTTAATGVQSPWVTRNSTTNHTAPNAAYAPNPAGIGTTALVSPALTLPQGQSQLSFRHFYSLEADPNGYFDGGVLEIKIGAGAFTDILTAGGSFVSGAYNGTISTDPQWQSPIAGRQAWSSNSVTFVTTVVNLPAAAAGQSVQLRWLCATDQDNDVGPTRGWYVDSIAVTGQVCAVNNPPVLPAQAGRTIAELTPLTVTNTATDPGSPPQGLTYLLVESPANALISTNGLITWTPTEAQGPGLYTFTTVVSDNALPSASATNSFTVTVNEVNSAPSLTLPGNQTVNELVPWTANASATDTDLPPNTLTYELVSGPAGLTLSPTGVFNWTPQPEQTPSTNTVTARVYDNGLPSLSNTNSFVLAVLGATPDPQPVIQTITVSNGVVTITWTAVASRNYRLEYRADSLAGTNWNESLAPVTAAGSTASATNAVSTAAQRFYRVRLLP